MHRPWLTGLPCMYQFTNGTYQDRTSLSSQTLLRWQSLPAEKPNSPKLPSPTHRTRQDMRRYELGFNNTAELSLTPKINRGKSCVLLTCKGCFPVILDGMQDAVNACAHLQMHYLLWQHDETISLQYHMLAMMVYLLLLVRNDPHTRIYWPHLTWKNGHTSHA